MAVEKNPATEKIEFGRADLMRRRGFWARKKLVEWRVFRVARNDEGFFEKAEVLLKINEFGLGFVAGSAFFFEDR